MALSKKWHLSAFDYHIDTFIVPCLVGIAITLASVVWWQILLGVFMWSLTEYCLHRFLFHKRFRRDHWAHHVEPQAYVGVSGIYVATLSTLMLLPAYLLDLTSLYAGFMLGYQAYLLVHFVIHRPKSRLYRLAKNWARTHDLHHRKGVEKNFGVTSPLWDVFFRTYVSPEQHERS